MSYDSGMVTVHHICQFSSSLTWINVFKQSSSKSWKTIFLPCSLQGIVPIHSANVSVYRLWFRPSIELKEKNMLEMFQFLHLALHFLASMAPLSWTHQEHCTESLLYISRCGEPSGSATWEVPLLLEGSVKTHQNLYEDTKFFLDLQPRWRFPNRGSLQLKQSQLLGSQPRSL